LWATLLNLEGKKKERNNTCGAIFGSFGLESIFVQLLQVAKEAAWTYSAFEHTKILEYLSN
jgi:hypothetical protein